MYQDALFEIFTFGMPNAVFLVYSLVCKEWNLLIKNKKFLQNYHQQVSKGIQQLLNPKSMEDRMFSSWLEFISHSHHAEYEMGMLLKRTLIFQVNENRFEKKEIEILEKSSNLTKSTLNIPPLLQYQVRFSMFDYKGERVSIFFSEQDNDSYVVEVLLNEKGNEILPDSLVNTSSRIDKKYYYGSGVYNAPWFEKSFRNYVNVFSQNILWNMFGGFMRIILQRPMQKRGLRLKSKYFASYFGDSFHDSFIQKLDRSIQSVEERNSLLLKSVKINNTSLASKLVDMGYVFKDVTELEEYCLIIPTFLKRGQLEFMAEYAERFGMNYRPLILHHIRKLVRSERDILTFLIEKELISNKFLFFALNTDTGEPLYEKIDHFKEIFPGIICPFDLRSETSENDKSGKKYLILFHNTYSELYSTDYLMDFKSKNPNIHIEMMKMPRRFIRSKESKRILSTQLKSYDQIIYYFDEIEFKKRGHYLGLIWKNLNWIQSTGIPFSIALSTNDLISLQYEMQLNYSFKESKIIIMTNDCESSFSRFNALLT